MRQFDNKLVEQFVKVETAYRLRLRRFTVYPLILAGGAAVFWICLLLSTKFEFMQGTALTFGLFTIVVGIIATRGLTRRKYVEFEYSFFDGEMSIAKITDKSKRKEQPGFSCEHVLSMSHNYDPTRGEDNAKRFSRIYDYSASEDDENRWFFVEDHQAAGKYLFILSPNEKMLSALREFVPKYNIQD